ncbi:MAG TPA: C4-type zinc ribbon domain-containing protein [Bryobacteraceae bacterium]|jgi:hypothetical protein|nr:C4-type zinc ribbon domain-containing protein [Bryobacteraceae bacterium]
MQQDLALALRLQALDRKIADLEKEIAALPKQIADLERKLQSHTVRLEADRAALAANQRDRKKAETEIQAHEQKISKLRDQMLQAKNNEQYRAFMNEIAYAEAEIRKAEDGILDLMEAAEPLDQNVKTAEIQLKKEREQIETEKARARERTIADQKALAEARAERESVFASMSPKVQAEYERIRRKTKGSVVADATEGRCSACQISLRPQPFQDLRKGETIINCESCGRMLTYNPVVDVSSNASASQQIA